MVNMKNIWRSVFDSCERYISEKLAFGAHFLVF
jgi:hypothetical protein